MSGAILCGSSRRWRRRGRVPVLCSRSRGPPGWYRRRFGMRSRRHIRPCAGEPGDGGAVGGRGGGAGGRVSGRIPHVQAVIAVVFVVWSVVALPAVPGTAVAGASRDKHDRGCWRMDTVNEPGLCACAATERTSDRSAASGGGAMRGEVRLPRDRPLPEIADYDRRLWRACGGYTERFQDLDEAFDKHHPAEPHHHLALLAVEPTRQRRGVGTALLECCHTRLDRAGMPAYLEASSAHSRRLYARHGYTDNGEPIDLPHNGPRLWPMWRTPNPGLPTAADPTAAPEVTKTPRSYLVPAAPSDPSRKWIIGPERVDWTNDYVRRYGQGQSLRQTAADTGRSYGFVHRILRDAGVSMRCRGRTRSRRPPDR